MTDLKGWLHHRNEGSLGSRPRLITVLFSNMRDYVPLCERLEPQQVGELMNAYFTEMGEVVVKYNGTIDKYIGDCFSAVYNALLVESPDHALKGWASARATPSSTTKEYNDARAR